jgi:hypothetical protein
MLHWERNGTFWWCWGELGPFQVKHRHSPSCLKYDRVIRVFCNHSVYRVERFKWPYATPLVTCACAHIWPYGTRLVTCACAHMSTHLTQGCPRVLTRTNQGVPPYLGVYSRYYRWYAWLKHVCQVVFHDSGLKPSSTNPFLLSWCLFLFAPLSLSTPFAPHFLLCIISSRMSHRGG